MMIKLIMILVLMSLVHWGYSLELRIEEENGVVTKFGLSDEDSECVNYYDNDKKIIRLTAVSRKDGERPSVVIAQLSRIDGKIKIASSSLSKLKVILYRSGKEAVEIALVDGVKFGSYQISVDQKTKDTSKTDE